MIRQLGKLKNQVKNWHIRNLNEEEYLELHKIKKDLDILSWFWKGLGGIFKNKICKPKFYKRQ